MGGDASGWVSAGAAVVAAGVVAWQSWETRKSAQASGAAVKAANAALDLNRQQVSEAIRARIDAAAPTITVHASEEVKWPPLQPSLYVGGTPQPAPNGPWYVPKQADEPIMVRASLIVRNESTVHVKIEMSPSILTDDLQPVESPLVLTPGGEFAGWASVTLPLSGWIDAYRKRQTGDPGRSPGPAVLFHDTADTGAIDRWQIDFDGTPVEPVPQIDGAWQLLSAPNRLSGMPGAIGVEAPLRERKYYLSQQRNEALPD